MNEGKNRMQRGKTDFEYLKTGPEGNKSGPQMTTYCHDNTLNKLSFGSAFPFRCSELLKQKERKTDDNNKQIYR